MPENLSTWRRVFAPLAHIERLTFGKTRDNATPTLGANSTKEGHAAREAMGHGPWVDLFRIKSWARAGKN